MQQQGVSRLGVVVALFVQVAQFVQVPETRKGGYSLKAPPKQPCRGRRELNSACDSKSCLRFARSDARSSRCLADCRCTEHSGKPTRVADGISFF